MKPALLLFFLFAASTSMSGQEYTRGVGNYPGEPHAYNGAILMPATQTYRNLALNRPAFASSSYDYNLTAQLVTDGIHDTKAPRWVAVTT